jgi:hypothetical protein
MLTGTAKAPFRRLHHEADLCVVGGGMAGLCAALAAARHGAKVVLMHDRPVLGGNSSSECRMHVCGADCSGTRPYMRETGLVEEIRLENIFRNPLKNLSVWDLVLLEKARFQPNLTLLLNCSCTDAAMNGAAIESVEGWQLTTQTRHTVKARYFADCSGDSVLAPLTGAAWRMGREARSEFNESIAPLRSDNRTMGMTCLFQARLHQTPQPFESPAWARKFKDCKELPYGFEGHDAWSYGYWWVELGGEKDALHDTETLRDELHALVLGIWDHIKNSGHHPESANWALEWLQFLPAKRESRRYEGDHILTQHDIEAEGPFDDVVAYGGWPMDDHHPAGFGAVALGEKATIFHPAPSPYGIPYRILYSRNIDNLFFAGRNASCTHAAMSSTRVMATCAVLGQAVGTAAALAAERGLSPRETGRSQIRELQARLLKDDCYLPGRRRDPSALTREAGLTASAGDPEPVRDGWTRQILADPHAWSTAPGGWVAYAFTKTARVREAEVILDTGMEVQVGMILQPGFDRDYRVSPAMPKAFRLEGRRGAAWETLFRCDDNRRRQWIIPVDRDLDGLRLVLETNHGAPESRVYAFTVS